MERSREQLSSSPASHDLMARFDMAHDRKDRLPAVREYLENLRPQILKLQRELKLQTQEDIDGLASRGDIDMREVEKLVDLIQAFRMAWTENRISVSEERRMDGERAVRVAGKAFREFGEIVDRAIGDQAPVYEVAAVIRATALAGESSLALKWYLDLRSNYGKGWSSESAWISPAHQLPTMTAMVRGLYAIGEQPRGIVSPDEMLRLLEDDELWADPVFGNDVLLRPQLAIDAAHAFCEIGSPNDAVSALEAVGQTIRWMDALDELRHASPNRQPFDDALLTAWNSNGILEDVHLLMLNGQVDEAMVKFQDSENKDALFSIVVGGLARNGTPENRDRTKEALALFYSRRSLDDDRIEATGRFVRVLLESDALAEALQVLDDDDVEDSVAIFPHETVAIVREMIRLKADPERIRAVAKTLFSKIRREPHVVYDAFRRIIQMMQESEIGTAGLLQMIKNFQPTSTSVLPFRELRRNALLEISAGQALRTFKRAARSYRAPGSSGDPGWNIGDWEEKARDMLKEYPGIAENLTYDEPIE